MINEGLRPSPRKVVDIDSLNVGAWTNAGCLADFEAHPKTGVSYLFQGDAAVDVATIRPSRSMAFDLYLARTGIPLSIGHGFGDDERDNLEAYATASAPNTLSAFKTDVTRWFAWCQIHKIDPLKPSARDVRDFIADFEEGRKPATVKRAVANIGVLTEGIAGNKSATKSKLVQAEMKRLRREKGSQHDQALPIRMKGDVGSMDDETLPFSIDRMIAVLEPDKSLKAARAKLILSLGGDSGRRNSEYRAAQIAHISPVPGGQGSFLIPRSKTDQDGMGMVKFACRRTMRLRREWLAVLKAAGGNVGPDAPMLVSVDRWGHPGRVALSIAGFNVALRNAIRMALDLLAVDHPELLEQIDDIVEAASGHSFRVGMVEDLTTAGESIVAICVEGGWKTSSMPVLYARNINSRRGAAARFRKMLGDEDEIDEPIAA